LRPHRLDGWRHGFAAFVPSKPVKEPPSESTEPILFADDTGHFEIRVERILKGERVFEEGLFYPFQMDSPKKEIIYFEVAVKNVSGPQEHTIWDSNFTLEDSAGNSYSCESTKDYIRGKIRIGTTGRGGIAFAVYKGNRSTKLIYDTGLVYLTYDGLSTGIKVLATANLQRVSFFQNESESAPTNR
jgi:hypothetical protein